MSDDAVVVDLKNDVQDGAIRFVYQNFRVGLPASTISYQRNTSRVTVGLQVRFTNTARVPVDEPHVPDVPVIHYSGGGYGAWMDLDDGDPTVALCMDGPVRGYYETGSMVTPGTRQSHDYGCAVALPGGRASATDNPTPPPNAVGTMLVGAADGTACAIFRRSGTAGGGAHVDPTELGTVIIAATGNSKSILLGGEPAAFSAAVAEAVLANLADLALRVSTWVPVPQDGGASLKAVFAAWAANLQDMADAKVGLQGPAV